MKEFFEKVAADWDTMRLAYYDERVIEKMVEASGLKEGMSVADVGTGTGFVAAGLASRVGQVVAVDNSPKMLKVPRENLGALGAGNVELVEGDIMDLALDERGVDAAFANMVLHHAGNTAAMLKEMARVVRTGGTVAICDEVELPYECMRGEQAEIWLEQLQVGVHDRVARAAELRSEVPGRGQPRPAPSRPARMAPLSAS